MDPMDLLNQLIVAGLQLFPRPFVKPFSMRYIAGEGLDDAVRVVRRLNLKQMMATVDILGENVLTKEESLAAVAATEDILHSIDQNHLNANLSIKPTQFGLKIDEALCYSNVKRILEIARGYSNFVRMDMEDSSTTSATLTLHERLCSDGVENVGVVIQANMRRSEADIRRLIPLKANVRLCKGAYIEPAEMSFRGGEEIRHNFLKILKMLLDGKCYVAIATHDDLLIDGAYRYIEGMKLSKSEYEFQMLYGVRTKLRDKIVADGHRLRIYVPFGEYWYAYSMRRFKENPQIARHVLRALFIRD
jgi:proline dehydrogenase